MDKDRRRRIIAGLIAQADKVVIETEELISLKEVAKGMMQGVIPGAHRDRLIAQKLIEQKLGGLKITSLGEFVEKRRH